MASVKWIKWFPGKWDRSLRVAKMTLAEQGAYRNFLDYQALQENGLIPNEPELFYRFAKCRRPEEWTEVSTAVLAMFREVEVDGKKYLSNDTLEENWKKAKAAIDKKIENGRMGGFTKAAKRTKRKAPSKVVAIASPLPEQVLSECSGKNVADSRFKDKDLNTSSDFSKSDDPDLFAVQNVWAHYLSKTGRSSTQYQFTDKRKAQGLRRFKERLEMRGGDRVLAESDLMRAVEALAASDWHMGRDPKTNGKKYCEWEDHLFPNYEKTEHWINQVGDRSALKGKTLLERSREARVGA